MGHFKVLNKSKKSGIIKWTKKNYFHKACFDQTMKNMAYARNVRRRWFKIYGMLTYQAGLKLKLVSQSFTNVLSTFWNEFYDKNIFAFMNFSDRSYNKMHYKLQLNGNFRRKKRKTPKKKRVKMMIKSSFGQFL